MDLYNAASQPEFDVEEAPTELTFDDYMSHKASCEKVIQEAGAAARLAHNDDFKQLIMGAFMEGEPKRLAMLIASGGLPPASNVAAFEHLKGIGYLKTFLSDMFQKAQLAQEELDGLEAAWDAHVEAQSQENA